MMARMTVGKLELDPARSPAVLDTTTWDPSAAVRQVRALGVGFWDRVTTSPGRPPPEEPACRIHAGANTSFRGCDLTLATLGDGQEVFLATGPAATCAVLGPPLEAIELGDGRGLAIYPTDLAIVARLLREANPEKAPRAMGTVPRLGVGNRHTVAVWPALFRAMERAGFAANAIQNSRRELHLLADLEEGRPAHENHLFGFGRILEGHTGSTFEGLFQAGVMAALKAPTLPRYGADADHIQVKRGADGMARAKQVVAAARHYTFFTLDVSDILRYTATTSASAAEAVALVEEAIQSPAERRDVLAYHRRTRTVAGRRYALDDLQISRFAAKHWAALDAVEALLADLAVLKGAEPFDVELSIDENPPEIASAECITSPQELVFLAAELRRRRLRVSHLAPHFGVEKGTDYRCPDGLPGLEARVEVISGIAEWYGLMLDCHSGDDLGRPTRRVFGRATRGRTNFKVSPSLQTLLAATLADVQPELFRFWWDEVLDHVWEEAGRGAEHAVQCLRAFEAHPVPSASAPLFSSYCFFAVGRRDAEGRFVNRERLYDLTPSLLEEYGRRLEAMLIEVAEDIYGQ
jgi:hypothetical protein